MDLVVGATGLLGAQICLKLLRRGRRVRALVRQGASADRVSALETAGAELVRGDLRDPASLARACAGVSHVVSTASSTQSRQAGDDIGSVDRDGHLALIAAAQEARIQHFMFISFPPAKLQFALQDAKRTVEDRLRRSEMRYTCLQPPHFFETWFGPDLGFDVLERRARLYGSGTAKVSFVSRDDVAHAAAALLGSSDAYDKTLLCPGPAAVSQRDMLRLFEELTGQPFTTETVEETALEQQLSDPNPLVSSFAALMLLCGAREDYRIEDRTLGSMLAHDFKSAQHFARATLENREPGRD